MTQSIDEPRLLQLLTEAQSTMARLFEARARHIGLTRPQWRIVSGLYGNAGITQTELSEITSIARSPLGKVVDQLEERGLLERRSDPDDRRINRLFLTGAVQPLVSPAREVAAQLEQSILEGIEYENPISLLDQLSQRLDDLMTAELHLTHNTN